MNAKPYRVFADIIRRRRKELDLTLSDVAEGMEWSVPYVSELERGVKQPPPLERVELLAQILQIDPMMLRHEAELSRRTVELDLEGAGATHRQLAVLLHRRFQEGLSEDEALRLLEAVRQLRDGEEDEQHVV
ncbi:MAG: helix-turn-helix transcriptional regulator [Chloroflexia bacterium]|nr:helix-turn-helix transcriptional regulator [Chloroflexia bacterium]